MWLSMHLRIQPGHPEPKRHLQEDRAQNFPRGSHPMKRMVSAFWKISVDLVSNNSSEKAGIADQLMMFSDPYTLGTLIVEYQCDIQNISQRGKHPGQSEGWQYASQLNMNYTWCAPEDKAAALPKSHVLGKNLGRAFFRKQS